MQQKGEKEKKRKKTGIINKLFSGKILSDERLTKHAGLLTLIIFYVILYISNRYTYQEELREIARLKREVEILRYDALTRKSELSEKSRQSHIQDWVQQKNSELKIATNPPYIIK